MANDWKKTARGQALEVLEEVFQEGAYSNIALNVHLSKSQLTDKDKALVTEIVYGTVARKITLEWILAHVIEDRDKLEPWVYDLLLLSLYQLAYLDKIPAHAVVNDAVSIAKNRGNKRVLRSWSMRFFVNYLASLCQIQARLNVSINAIPFSILYLCGWLKNLSTSTGKTVPLLFSKASL